MQVQKVHNFNNKQISFEKCIIYRTSSPMKARALASQCLSDLDMAIKIRENSLAKGIKVSPRVTLAKLKAARNSLMQTLGLSRKKKHRPFNK